jgi:hypothetical protein
VGRGRGEARPSPATCVRVEQKPCKEPRHRPAADGAAEAIGRGVLLSDSLSPLKVETPTRRLQTQRRPTSIPPQHDSEECHVLGSLCVGVCLHASCNSGDVHAWSARHCLLATMGSCKQTCPEATKPYCA